MADLAPENKLPPSVSELLTKLFDQEGNFATKIEKLDAPDDAKATRDEAVAALRAEVAFGRSIVDGITGGTTLADLNGKFEGDAGSQIDERRSKACLGMQKLADDNGIKVDMTCCGRPADGESGGPTGG